MKGGGGGGEGAGEGRGDGRERRSKNMTQRRGRMCLWMVKGMWIKGVIGGAFFG